MRRPQSPPLNPPPLTVGSIAPDFTLSDYNGKVYRLSDYRGKKGLLSFFCGCGACTQLALTWEKIHRQRADVPVLGISTMNPATMHEWCRSVGVTFPTLFDPNYGVAEVYESTNCPRSWVIDERGKVVYTSREEDSPSDVTRALQQSLAVSKEVLDIGQGRK